MGNTAMAEKEKTLEELLTELETLVGSVENDVMPLEKMVDRITHGAAIIRQCRNKLNAMNAKVELLLKDDGAQGEFTDFNPESERANAAAPEKSAQSKKAKQNNQQDDLPF